MRYRFGPFELDPDRGELRRAGTLVRLQAKPFRLLALLVSRAPEPVTRDAIRQHVWSSDVNVEFDQGINACVKQIRHALGDDADVPRFVETIPRAGYRFLAPVEVLDVPLTAASPPSRARRRWVAAIAVVAFLVLGAVGRSAWVARQRAEQPRPVLAVLPFDVLGGEPGDEFFRDALTEELITQLGRSYGGSMGVIARTSVMKYKESDVSIREIGKTLGADYVLEGSVRRTGDRMRVTAQLIRAADESHVWASAFQRESGDLGALQLELGETIARGLALKLVPSADSIAAATRPDVYEAYLRGRHFMAESKLDRARLELERATTLDPGFASAWSALAETYRALAGEAGTGPQARAAVARALALDDELAEAHLTLGLIRFYQDFDYEGARESFERALELNPAYAEAHHNFAAYYSVQGRHDEAIAEVQRARGLDPLSTDVDADVCWYHYFARRFEPAVEYSKRTLLLDPDSYWAKLCMQMAYLQRPDWQSAIEPARSAMTAAQAAPELLAQLDSKDRQTALSAYWTWRLQVLEKYREKHFVAPAGLAQVHMALGEREVALAELLASFESRTGWILPFLTVDPLFDPLRGDPRFEDLLARIQSASAPSARAARPRPPQPS